jgi:lipoate-protein ligase B
MSQANKTCWVVNLNLAPYARACELQQRVVAARKAGAVPDVLLLCEHPHAITLGRNGKREHLRVSEPLLLERGVEFHSTDRGGDITYHGPGQLVGYPILDLASIRRDVAWYVRQLEEAMIRATADFGIAAGRKSGLTGVWVTSHGFAYNLSTDLRYFDWIVPCGIPDKRATSLEKLLGRSVSREEAAPRIVSRFGEVFSFEMRNVSIDELEENLGAHEATSAVRPGGLPEREAVTATVGGMGSHG